MDVETEKRFVGRSLLSVPSDSRKKKNCKSVIEKTIAEMQTLLKIIVEALKAQPNIKNTIKKGLPRIVDQLEEL